MILVTTGTNGTSFDRLLREVNNIGNGEVVTVQHGPSALRPLGAKCIDYVSFAELVELVRSARVVITHGGVGTILVALMNGKRPIVVPRLMRFGEAVDDHQLELARKLDEIGAVTLVEEPARLAEVLQGEVDSSEPVEQDQRKLRADLAAYLGSIVGSPGTPLEPAATRRSARLNNR